MVSFEGLVSTYNSVFDQKMPKTEVSRGTVTAFTCRAAEREGLCGSTLNLRVEAVSKVGAFLQGVREGLDVQD